MEAISPVLEQQQESLVIQLDHTESPFQLTILPTSITGQTETTLTQTGGTSGGVFFEESDPRPNPNVPGQTLDGEFTFYSSSPLAPGVYEFEARVSDGSSSDEITNIRVYQQGITTLWNGNVVQAEESNYGQGYGIFDTTTQNIGNNSSYRNDGLDISSSADGLITYVSHIGAGETISYTAWTPDGSNQTLRFMVSTNSNFAKSFEVYIDGVFQDTATFSRIGEASPSQWESFQPVDVNVNLNGRYETIQIKALDGGFNIDSFSLL